MILGLASHLGHDAASGKGLFVFPQRMHYVTQLGLASFDLTIKMTSGSAVQAALGIGVQK
jgi:hypothetical protein